MYYEKCYMNMFGYEQQSRNVLKVKTLSDDRMSQLATLGGSSQVRSTATQHFMTRAT